MIDNSRWIAVKENTDKLKNIVAQTEESGKLTPADLGKMSFLALFVHEQTEKMLIQLRK